MIRGALPERPTSRATQGLRWTLFGTFATFVAQLAYTAVMSRLLTPGDFGLLALALFVLRFVSHFSQGGLSSAIVQRPVLEARDLRATFTLSITTGLVAYAVLWLLAPYAVTILGAPAGLTSVCRALGLTLVISAVGSTATGLLRRSMRYRTIALIELGSYVAGYCGIGLMCALTGRGIWSLVYAAIGQSALMTLGSYMFARHDLRLLVAGVPMRKMSSFGAKVSLVGFLEFLTIGIDNLLVGRYAGIEALGQYNRAILIAVLPLQQIGTAVGKVLFPIFSRMQLDHERLRSAYLDSMAMSTLLFLPMAAAIGAAASNFVFVLLGAGWQLAAQLVPVLAVAAALYVVVYFPASMAEAIGKVPMKALIEFLHLATLLLGAGLVVVCDGGLPGLVIAVLVGRLLQHTLYLLWMDRVIPRSLRQVLKVYAQSVAVAMAVGLAVAGVGRAIGEFAPTPVTLIAQVATMGLAGVSVVLWGGRLDGIRVARERALIPTSLVTKTRKAAACE